MKVKQQSQTRINGPVKPRGGSSEGSQSYNNIHHKNSFQSMQQPQNNYSQNIGVSQSKQFLPPMMQNQQLNNSQIQLQNNKLMYSNQIKNSEIQNSQQVNKNNLNQGSNISNNINKINNQQQGNGNISETINSKILQALQEQKQQKLNQNRNLQSGDGNSRLVTDPDANDNVSIKKNGQQTKKLYTLRQNSQNGNNYNINYNSNNSTIQEKKYNNIIVKQRKSHDNLVDKAGKLNQQNQGEQEEREVKKSGTAPTSEIQQLLQYTQSNKNQSHSLQNNNFVNQSHNPLLRKQSYQKQISKELLINTTEFKERKEYEEFDTSKLNPQQMREKIMIEQKIRETKIHSSKISQKKNGQINSYAANTHPGLFRGYNEDRVAIILNISKPQNKMCSYWPKCSYFAVYDGHGGNKCSDYLRDQMHQFIINDENFPQDPIKAIKNGVKKTDQEYLKISEQQQDRSGSCAVISLIVDDICYIVNVGDSRAVLSRQGGLIIDEVTQDHKPTLEEQRIKEAGGMVYQVNSNGVPQEFNFAGISMEAPHRVFPGKLSVCRTIGDIEAKLEKFGGNPNVVISDPDIFTLNIKDDYDFVLLASDGIFDRITSQETIQVVWNNIKERVQDEKDQYRNGECQQQSNIHQLSAHGVEKLLKKSFIRKTLDNVTVVMVTFQNFQKIISQIQNMEESINDYNFKSNENEAKYVIQSMNTLSQNQNNSHFGQNQNQSFSENNQHQQKQTPSNTNQFNQTTLSQSDKIRLLQNSILNSKTDSNQQSNKKIPDQKLKIIVHQKNTHSLGNSKGLSPGKNQYSMNGQINRNTGKHFRNLSHQQQNSTNFSSIQNDTSNNNGSNLLLNKQMLSQQQQISNLNQQQQQGKHNRNFTGYALQRQQNSQPIKHLKSSQLNEGYYYQPKNQNQQGNNNINSQLLTIQQTQDKGLNNNSNINKNQYVNNVEKINSSNTTQKRSFSQPFNALFNNNNSNNNINMQHQRQNSYGSKRQIQSVQIKSNNNSNYPMHPNKPGNINQNNSPIKIRVPNNQY